MAVHQAQWRCYCSLQQVLGCWATAAHHNFMTLLSTGFATLNRWAVKASHSQRCLAIAKAIARRFKALKLGDEDGYRIAWFTRTWRVAMMRDAGTPELQRPKRVNRPKEPHS